MCTFDYTPEQLRDITLELLSREGWRQNVYIRPLAYKDDDIFRLWLHDGTDKVAIFTQPYDKYIAALEYSQRVDLASSNVTNQQMGNGNRITVAVQGQQEHPPGR